MHNYGLEREQVIFPVEKAEEKGSVAILKGNLAPEGAVIKYSACSQDMRGAGKVLQEFLTAKRLLIRQWWMERFIREIC